MPKDIIAKKKFNIKFNSKGSNPKDTEFMGNIQFIREIDSLLDDGGLIAMPLEKGKKINHFTLGQKGGPCRTKNGAWKWENMDHILEGDAVNVPKIDKEPADLGALISGSLGVLDFDCESAWLWFTSKFDIDLNKYLVVEGSSTAHKCECGREVDKTYHIYFLRTQHLVNRSCRTRCIYDEEHQERMMIDFIVEYDTGTPHVIKIPQGKTGVKKWLNKDIDAIISLPEDVLAHFETHWYEPPSTRKDIEEIDKWMELLNTLLKSQPSFHFNGAKYYNILKTLKIIGIKYSDVYKWSSQLKQSKEQTSIKHSTWLQREWYRLDLNDARELRNGNIIKTLIKLECPDEYDKVWNKYLGVTGRDFGITYIHDFIDAKMDISEKRNKIADIYNKFFVVETGADPCIYKLSYTENGKFKSHTRCKGAVEMSRFMGQNIVLYEDAKPTCSFMWWFNNCKSSWYKGVCFEPYGIIHNREEKLSKEKKGWFNTFPGYQIDYKPDYVCEDEEVSKKGELIYNHVKEVFCKGSEKMTLVVLAWLSTVLVHGKQAKLMLVLYSQIHGAGKSLWWEWMLKIVVGEGMFSKTADFKTMVGSQFTEGIMDKVVGLIEEIPQFRHDGGKAGSGSGQLWSKIKSYITDRLQHGEKKFQASRGWDNYNSWVGLTNNPNCMHPEIPARRAIMLAISNHRANDTKYHSNLIEALESYECWEYFIHKYLIKNDNIKTLVRTMAPNSKWLDDNADTEWRQMSLKKAVTSFIQWWVVIVDGWKSLSEDELSINHMIGKHIPITNYTDPKGRVYTGLLESYMKYCEDNGEYCLVKNANQFKTRMEQDFETQAKIIQTFGEKLPIKAGTDMKLFDGQSGGRKRYGEYIIFTEPLLVKIQGVCDRLINDKSVVIKMSEADHALNIESIDCEDYGNDLEFQNY